MATGATRYRVTLLVLGLVFVVIVGATMLALPSGGDGTLPHPVQEISPEDGDLVLRQTDLVMRLEPGYRAQLVIDGVAVPLDQVIFTPETGLHVFAPGPGKVIEEWLPGFHIVDAAWDTLSGVPDTGSMRWSFRVA